jgi:WD40 repeat protein
MPERFNFTDLKYSRGRLLACIDWHPKSKNVVAVSCIENRSFDERVEHSGVAVHAFTLIWNFSDSIRPQLCLQSPHESRKFAFNPTNANVIAAGCSTGQVLVWDIGRAQEDFRRRQNKGGRVAVGGGGGESKGGGEDGGDGGGEPKTVPPVQPKMISHIDSSHQFAVSDLVWLPAGMEITARGDVVKTDDAQSFQVGDGH